jgi:hypothetical protein
MLTASHRALATLCPLDAWPHLKRLRRHPPTDAAAASADTLQVLLAPVATWPDPAPLCAALAERGVVVTAPAATPVPRAAPVTAAQFDAWKLVWPVTFHPPRPFV